MTAPGASPRTLIVGPLGARPWVTTADLAAQLRSIGHDVLVNGEGTVVPYPTPLPSNVGRLAVALPRVVFWLVRMMRSWRRDARAALRDAGVTHIVVWDPVVCALYRVARPEAIELVWVVPPPEGARAHQRLLRAALLLTVDRRIVTAPGATRLRRRRETVVPVAAQPAASSNVDGWVVLGSASASSAALAELERRSADSPAMAVIFDARDHDVLGPADAENLRRASRAAQVLWAIDDAWLGYLPTVPRLAVDVRTVPEPDHRHAALARAGTSNVRSGPLRSSSATGGVDDRDWAAAVFRPR